MATSPCVNFAANKMRPPTTSPPRKAIALAAFLFVVGLTMVIASSYAYAHASAAIRDRFMPLIVIGSLTLPPGAWVLRIALYSYMQVPGYSYAQIPHVE